MKQQVVYDMYIHLEVIYDAINNDECRIMRITVPRHVEGGTTCPCKTAYISSVYGKTYNLTTFIPTPRASLYISSLCCSG